MLSPLSEDESYILYCFYRLALNSHRNTPSPCAALLPTCSPPLPWFSVKVALCVRSMCSACAPLLASPYYPATAAVCRSFCAHSSPVPTLSCCVAGDFLPLSCCPFLYYWRRQLFDTATVVVAAADWIIYGDNFLPPFACDLPITCCQRQLLPRGFGRLHREAYTL